MSNYKDPEKKRQQDANYRRQHWFAIKLKNQVYRRLPHVKERRREYGRSPARKAYHQKYYQEHKDYWRAKNAEWVKNNPEKRKEILRRYAEKLARRRKRKNMRSSIERVIKEYLDYCNQRYDPATLVPYKRNIERFYEYIVNHKTRCPEYHARFSKEMLKPEAERDFSWTEEFKRLEHAEDLDKDYINRYVSYVNHDEVNKKTRQPLNQPEKESRLYPLKSFLWFCLRKGYIKKDLRKYIVVPPREKKNLKRVMTQDEMTRFLEAPNVSDDLGLRDRAMLELSYSGPRSEEILGIKLKDIDIVTNTMTILDGKGNKDRVIPMTQAALYWIKSWLDLRPKFIKDKEDPGFVFISKSAKAINRRNFASMVKNYTVKAKIDLNVSPHDLRRTAATHLVENGAPIRLIQVLLGHTTLGVTTKYLRLSDEKIKKEHKNSHPANRRKLYYGDIEAEIPRASDQG